jgi:hypothetical protein
VSTTPFQNPTTPPTLSGQDIGEAQGAVAALLESALASTGFTSDEFIALRVLASRGPFPEPRLLHEYLATQRQLRLDVPGSVRLLGGLEARGLAGGTAPDGPGPAQLTDAGRETLAWLGQAVSAASARLYGEMDQDDLATAHRVLAAVVERASTLSRELVAQ